MVIEAYKRELLTLLARHAYKYNSKSAFILANGSTSNEYLDCKLALSHPNALRLVGAVVYGLLSSRVTAVGGMTMGADPIAISTITNTLSLRWFSIRKGPKTHGSKRQIEGDIREWDIVTVLEDVVTTGETTINAVNICQREGLKVLEVIALVDRQHKPNGLVRIRDTAKCDVKAVFTLDEIRKEWQEQQHH